MSDTNEKSDWQKREVGALWKNEGRQQKYLSGYIKTPEGDMKNRFTKRLDACPKMLLSKPSRLSQRTYKN